LVLHHDELAMLRVSWPIVGTLVRKGIPMSGQMLVLSLSGVLMISLVNRFGVQTTAAFGASLQLWNYVLMPAFAVSMGVSSMAAQNLGAGKWDRVGSIARVGVLYSVLVTACVVLLLEILNRHAYQLFLPAGSEALRIAGHINRTATWSFIFFGVSMTLFGVVRTAGAVMMPLLVTIVTLLGVRFPLAQALLGHWQADAIWWSFPISSALSAALAVLYYKFGGWRTARLAGTHDKTSAQPAGTS
jgi:Na+-driven multidrug efflux pump